MQWNSPFYELPKNQEKQNLVLKQARSLVRDAFPLKYKGGGFRKVTKKELVGALSPVNHKGLHQG